MPPRDLLAEFPLRVRFPLTGKYLLLEWWTEDEQKHVSAARTLDPLVCIWKAVLASDTFNYDAKPTGFYRAEIVSPPLWMRDKEAQYRFEQERFDFISWVVGLLVEYGWNSKTKELPPGVSRCSKAGGDDYHTCDKCLSGYLIQGRTVEAFYEEKQAEFREHYVRDAKGVVSPAPEVKQGQPLFFVSSDPGHHATGTHVVAHDGDELPGGDPLFFFTGASEEIPTAILDLHRAHRQRVEEKTRIFEEKNKVRHANKKQVRALEVETLLKKLFP